VLPKDTPTKKDLLEAIRRSGYLFESEIANTLANAGFFIETNQVVKDPVTGKSREIDLTAEYYERDDKERAGLRAYSRIHFIFEIKNNIFPLVLMTKYEFSPNIDIWESIKEIQTTPEGIDWSASEGFYDKLLMENDQNLYTQYCSFEHKKNKDKNKTLMALHPEQVHKGLSKITQYCEEVIEFWNDREKDDVYRKFLYLPVLLIKDDLYELRINKNSKPHLNKVDESKLIFNYHFKENPKMSTVWVVTQKGFLKFMKNMVKQERIVEEEMISIIRTRTSNDKR